MARNDLWYSRSGFDFQMFGRAFYYDSHIPYELNYSVQGQTTQNHGDIVLKNISFCKSIKSIKTLAKYISENSEGLKSPENFYDVYGQEVTFQDELNRWNLIPDKDNLKKGISLSARNLKDGDQFKLRQAAHMLVSLPLEYKDLSREAFNEIMVDYLKPFHDFNPVYVQHRHQGHLHAHIIFPLVSEDKQLKLDFSKNFTFSLRQHFGAVCRMHNLDVTVSQKTPSKRILNKIEAELADMKEQGRGRKVNLQKQVKHWYDRHGLEYQLRRSGIQDKSTDHLKPVLYKIPDMDKQSEENLNKWAQNMFEEPEEAKSRLKEMLGEKPKTAFWYANHQPLIFGELKSNYIRTSINERDVKVGAEWKKEVLDFFLELKEDENVIKERRNLAEKISFNRTSERYSKALRIFELDIVKSGLSKKTKEIEYER